MIIGGRHSSWRFAEPVLLGVLLLALIVALQSLGGAYSNDFGGNSDEPAHFVSAVMLRDFLLHGGFSHPAAFARSFYLHYPKVAIGQWPPMLYAILGGWMVVFGVSRAAALAMIAVAAGATATLIYLVGRPRVGRPAALLACVVFLASPLVQESSDRVMTEHVVTLLAFASALEFARYVRTVRLADAMLFGILSALAILTRGSAWPLALVPGLTILLTRRFDLLWRPSLWLSALPVLVTCVPWYLATAKGVTSSWTTTGGTPYWMIAVPFYARSIWQGLGSLVAAAALLGCWGSLVRPWARRAVDPVYAALAALLAGTLLLHCAVPTGLSDRFMVAVLPEIVLFAAYGIVWLAGSLDRMVPRPPWSAVLCLVVALGFLAGTFTVPRTALRFTGFAAAARLLPSKSATQSPAFLVISDEKGEGAAVAELAIDQGWPGSFMLRGSKIFVREDWLGRGALDRFPTQGDVAKLLDQIPVTGILLDASIPAYRQEPFQQRVRDTVIANSQTWDRVASLSVDRQGQVFPDAVQVYLRRPVPGSPPPAVDQALLRRLIFENFDR
jgi:hypothetical protein